MSFKQTLENIANKYIPGCQEFYNQFPNDPWQKANDDYESFVVKAINERTEENLENEKVAEKIYEQRMLALIESFKSIQDSQKIKVSPAITGFWEGLKSHKETNAINKLDYIK